MKTGICLFVVGAGSGGLIAGGDILHFRLFGCSIFISFSSMSSFLVRHLRLGSFLMFLLFFNVINRYVIELKMASSRRRDYPYNVCNVYLHMIVSIISLQM